MSSPGPFVGESPDDFKRTGNRHDYAIEPPEPTLLDRVSEAGFDVYAIGKISDIYAGARRHPQDQGLGQYGA